MNKLHAFLSHATVILALMFIVFLILDQFNPLMNFVDNAISHWLLAALCLSGIGQSILHWRQASRDAEWTQPSRRRMRIRFQ